MEKARRDILHTTIAAVRRDVRKSLEQQLARLGLFVDAPSLPWEDLGLPATEELRYRAIVEGVLREARAVGATHATPPAVARFVREVGGTWINRLAALRALEVRALLAPAAAFVSDEYGGVSLRASRLRDRAADAGQSLGKDESLRLALEDAFRELSEHVRVLFDLGDEASLLWPDGPTLREVLKRFSVDVSDEDWRQDDVLGWVYQYYNTEANAELKRRKNRTTGFKLSADDVPIANQFYTPHWVVRVLVDNTLGRLWLESRGRCPRLLANPSGGYRLDEARRGVPRADTQREAFEHWIREEPDPGRDLSIDVLCRYLTPLPSEAPPRPPMRARDLRVLDPACGSGHFLLYAFDVLYAAYREDEAGLDPREIPALILERNLYGIDIDQRAAQLAAFSLYLKARTVLAAVDPTTPLVVRGLNVVVADAHLGEDPRKTVFLERFRRDPEVQDLYATVLSGLDHTNVLGSLLKVRSEFEKLFGPADAQKRVKAERTRAAFKKRGQEDLFPIGPQTELADRFVTQAGRGYTLDALLEDVRAFERESAPAQDVGTRLFGTEVARAAGVLALLSQQYDVVLMNPPYGDMPEQTREYLKGNQKKKVRARYPRSHSDLYAAFLDQGVDLLRANGLLGALVPWTYSYLSSLEQLRKDLFVHDARLELGHAYGYGILDGATVGTLGTVARRALTSAPAARGDHPILFQRFSGQKRDWEKLAAFESKLPEAASGSLKAEHDLFVVTVESLMTVPGMPYTYWASDSLRALFKKFPPLDRSQKGALTEGRPNVEIAVARQGLSTGDDARFIRFWWEIPATSIGRACRWVPFAKGGAAVRFATRIDLVVNWENDGAEIKRWVETSRGGSSSEYVRSPDYYFREGVTWPPASWRIRRFGLVPEGGVFGHKGCVVFPSAITAPETLAVLNSSVVSTLMIAQTPERMWEVGTVGGLPIPGGVSGNERLSCAASRLEELVKKGDHEGDETCRDFVEPALLAAFRKCPGSLLLAELLAVCERQRAERANEEEVLLKELDAEVVALYELTSSDRELVTRELTRRPGGDGGPSLGEEPSSGDDETRLAAGKEGEGEDSSAEQTLAPLGGQTANLVARWISLYVKRVIEGDDDGIVPLAATAGEAALVQRVVEAMSADLGDEAARALAEQAPAYLGSPDLATWLETGYFPWHVQLYGNRPPFWLLSSEGFERSRSRITFRAFVNALRVSADTLPRLASYYVEPVLERATVEAHQAREAALVRSGKEKRAAQDAAREWQASVDALKAFRGALENVALGPPKAERPAANAKWIARTIAAVRGGRDVGYGYRPVVDHGIRVNIKPLAEQKLFPRAVLARLGG